jgi:hypothetical protein
MLITICIIIIKDLRQFVHDSCKECKLWKRWEKSLLT